MTHPDELLVRRAQRGDRRARQELVQRLTSVLSARARIFARTHGVGWDVGDMVQSAWVGLADQDYRRLLRWSAAGGKRLEGFVGDVANGLWLNWWRDEHAKKRGKGMTENSDFTDILAPGASPEHITISRDLLARLWSFLMENLPARGLSVLRLTFTDGLGSAEAAAALGVNVQVIDNWVFKIRTLARQFLAVHGTVDG